MTTHITDRGRWPSILMRLIGSESGDSWDSVMARLETHPEEVLLNEGGGSCLHAACVRYPPLHVVQALLRVAPEATLLQNSDGETPLHLATFGAGEDVQLALLQAAPLSVELQDQYGDSPLHLAARSGATRPVLQAMVQASPNTIHLPNVRGVTPFFSLPRSYPAARTLQELSEQDEMRDDWETALLFLQASHPNDISVVHRAAATPSTPPDFWKTLLRFVSSDVALQRNMNGDTPLLLVTQHPPLPEPPQYDEAEDGFREETDVVEVEFEEAVPPTDNAALPNILDPTEDDDDSKEGTLLEWVVRWNPRAARLADRRGRLPLAHAILAGHYTWRHGMKHLVWAAPQALDTRDTHTNLYPYQLAAFYSNDLDTIYHLVRSSPQHFGRR